MKTSRIIYILVAFALFAPFVQAQVGIGNTSPKSILDIQASDQTAPASTDGILIPRIDAFPAIDPGTDQNGMLVYLTTDGEGFTGEAFYFWENSQWNSISNNSGNHYVGEAYGGGIVFYIWADGVHGLIASPENLNSNNPVKWSISNSDISGAESPRDGAANTTAIVSNQGTGTYAAKLCDDYTGGGETDWYLPSLWELNLLYNGAYVISNSYASTSGWFEFNADDDTRYWSSTQKDNDEAYAQKIIEGRAEKKRKTESHMVRAIRSF